MECQVSAINALLSRVWKCFAIQIKPATFSGLGIMEDWTPAKEKKHPSLQSGESISMPGICRESDFFYSAFPEKG